MSTPTMTALPADQGAASAIPWANLVWVTWRRHRATVLSVFALVALAGIFLVVEGRSSRSAWHVIDACKPQRSSACQFAWQNFQQTHGDPGIWGVVFIFAPLLIGAFAGAPLIGRELETGTFRYAWTQGVGRMRWTVAMIATGALAVAALSGAFGALVSWRENPLWQADVTQRLQPTLFPATGVAIVGWSLAAYAVGVLAGVVFRRVLPALALTVVSMFGLAYATSRFRLHYLAPLRTQSLDHPIGSQTISQWWEKDGHPVGASQLNEALRAAGLGQINFGGGGKTSVEVRPGSGADPIVYLRHHGYIQWTSYQPAHRYWIFQWMELGWLTVLALLLVLVAALLVNRRDA